ncbi:MAG: flagellar hook-basal body complex protein FliE [Clostridia bacterium]|nr:flagellar hook-basal body complex protein FliE [Clostridia bacterium]MDD4665249.1 flagellar hook-basal body complex protein FliE [Clostridia bacterium]
MEIKGINSLSALEFGKNNNQVKDNVQNFGDFLKNALSKVNTTQLQAEQMTSDFVIGNNVELHQVVLATEKAALALQLTMQIRNKVIEAYQELMRMQI